VTAIFLAHVQSNRYSRLEENAILAVRVVESKRANPEALRRDSLRPSDRLKDNYGKSNKRNIGRHVVTRSGVQRMSDAIGGGVDVGDALA
jgi:hypothetical protein